MTAAKLGELPAWPVQPVVRLGEDYKIIAYHVAMAAALRARLELAVGIIQSHALRKAMGNDMANDLSPLNEMYAVIEACREPK